MDIVFPTSSLGYASDSTSMIAELIKSIDAMNANMHEVLEMLRNIANANNMDNVTEKLVRRSKGWR